MRLNEIGPSPPGPRSVRELALCVYGMYACMYVLCMCLSVCLSVCHLFLLGKGGRRDETDRLVGYMYVHTYVPPFIVRFFPSPLDLKLPRGHRQELAFTS